LADAAIDLLSNKANIYASATGGKPLRALDDEESVVLDSSLTYDKLPGRLPIEATRRLNVEFTDGATNVPVEYDLPVEQDGYIDVINLAHFDDSSSAYMSIVRSLILAQAGDCDAAFSVYQHVADELDRETRVQMLIIIAHLHGQGGGNVSTVLDELERWAENEELQYLEVYQALNKENL
jgi:hypothetical protein